MRCKAGCIIASPRHVQINKMLSCRKETAQQGALVLAKSYRLELGDDILRTL